MSGRHHAPTIVRIWVDDYSGESQNFDVDDWEWGRFTLPIDHPATSVLRTCHKRMILVTVESTPELEWWVETVAWGKYSSQITCKPREPRKRLLPDAFLIKQGMVS